MEASWDDVDVIILARGNRHEAIIEDTLGCPRLYDVAGGFCASRERRR